MARRYSRLPRVVQPYPSLAGERCFIYAGDWEPRSPVTFRFANFAELFSRLFTPKVSPKLEQEEKASPPRPNIPKADREQLSKIHHVKSVDLHVEENSKSHRTDKYGVVQKGMLVVRRGQEFKMTLTFNKTFDKEKDDLRLMFLIGDCPCPGKKSEVHFGFSQKNLPNQWWSEIVSQSGATVTVNVHSPPDCIVGEWDLMVETVVKKDLDYESFIYDHSEPIYLLFNPWCKEDQVHFTDESLLDEYILNDFGMLFHGTSDCIFTKPWNFGQFEDDILDICLYILRKGFRAVGPEMGDAVTVSRVVTKMLSAPEDGVLMGNYGVEDSDGRRPTAWGGSVTILLQYKETTAPVKYAQSLVHSGVLTTVCRALGIPCRSISSFSSPHDSDKNVAVDVYYSLGTEKIPVLTPLLNRDNLWNFHLWNEVWMRRYDLPVGYSGWQAIDCTPQEACDGEYSCGPTPVAAVRNGEVNLPYDTKFVFAEVNTDKIFWLKAKREWKILQIQKNAAGKMISTKKAGCALPDADVDQIREDVTSQYKQTEDLELERISTMNATRRETRNWAQYKVDVEDVEFELEKRSPVLIGQPVTITLKITNGGKDRTVRVTLQCEAITYNSAIRANCRDGYFVQCMKPSSTQSVTLEVMFEDYASFLQRERDSRLCMKVFAMAGVLETEQLFTEEALVPLRWPDLGIQSPAEAKVEEEINCTFTLENPLPIPISRCELTVEGPGWDKPKRIKVDDVEGSRKLSLSVMLKSKRSGTRHIVATFDSLELQDITGSATLHVT